MIARFILFAVLLGLLVWIPLAAPRGFDAAPILVVGLLAVAAVLTFWRRHPTDE